MVVIKSKQEIGKIRRACVLVAEILDHLREMVAPGLSIRELEKEAECMAQKKSAIPAFKGYHGYPSALCVSVNDVVIHGIPGMKKLKSGDLVGLDFGILLDGYYGDAATTVPVGKISPEAERLLKVTEHALYEGIGKAVPGNRIGDISCAIQTYVEKNGFSVIREFTGHGIGKALHEEPPIPNYGKRGIGLLIEEGMTFALEPMVTAGSFEVDVQSDGWTVTTRDGSLSAHFEHTIAIRERRAEILTIIPRH
jgi:methionyl aminopeptidase